MHDEPHVTIVRIDDAVVEEQPLVDVIDADMMRLGKRITKEPIARGRAKNRDRKITKKHSKHVRGSAPSRKRNSPIKNSGGGTPGQTTGRVESSRSSQYTGLGSRGTQEPRQQANHYMQRHGGPGNRGAITGRDHAHPGRAERGVSSGQHRRPAQKVAAGHPAGDVAGPND